MEFRAFPLLADGIRSTPRRKIYIRKEMAAMSERTNLPAVIAAYKADRESVYHTWFVGGEARMKAFRAIRRGVRDTVDATAAGSFGTDFKGSPLEVVLNAITEQKQVFEGAAHPFYWKPKLRIPDIYENEPNQRAFGNFLNACLNASREDQLLAEISRLAQANIKGLGPAIASIVYFLHPTLIPPFNTAIVNGFNALFGAKQKLGSWDSYLEMRETIVRTNDEHRHLLSKDLGAFVGMLFDIGCGRIVLAGNADSILKDLHEKAAKVARKRHEEAAADERAESEHTQIQHVLIRLGRALDYDVFVARNDRHRVCHGEDFSLLTVPVLPELGLAEEVRDTVELIDVLWMHRTGPGIACAFEVEQSTSIYSGILRMKDLALSVPGGDGHYYLVAPEAREQEVMAQMARPSMQSPQQVFRLGYLPAGELRQQCDAMCRFGTDRNVLLKIAKTYGLHA